MLDKIETFHLKTAQQNAQFLTNQARISGEFLELARTERQAGNRTLLDVLNGETAFINAQADAIAARIEVLINSYTLISLMGGLSIDSIELVIFFSSSSPNLEDSSFVLRSLIKKTITPKEITEKIDRITTTESIDEYFRTY